jgi:hypothetical protein
MSGLAAGIVSAAIAAVAFVFLRRWRRHDRHDLAVVGIGAVVLVISLVIGLWLLPIEEAPRQEPASVGVQAPAKPRPGRGFIVGMGVFVKDCGEPVRVVLVANGTAEFWRDQARVVPHRAPFRFAVPGTDLRAVKLGVSTDATDISNPIYADPEKHGYFTADPARETNGVTVLSGHVFDWPARLSAVVASFQADWLSDRGIGSCYLSLPSLTGALTVLATNQALGRVSRDPREIAQPGVPIVRSERTGLAAVYNPRLETTYGTTTVVVAGGDVLAEGSLPAPDQTIDGNSTWVCETKPARSRALVEAAKPGGRADLLISRDKTGAAYSRAYLRDARGTDCSSVAVVIENRAGTLRDLVLLLLGASLSLGAAIVVEGLLDRLRPAQRQHRRRRRG